MQLHFGCPLEESGTQANRLHRRDLLKILYIVALVVFTRTTFADTQSQGQQPLTADLARYYFASPEIELAARAELDQALRGLQSYEGRLDNGPNLLMALQAYEKVQTLYRRHDGYLHLRCARNRDGAACGDEQQLQSTTAAQVAFLTPAILALGKPRLEALLVTEPRLTPYRFALEAMLRDSEHTLAKDLQACLDRVHPELADWQYDLYEQILAGISFGTVETQSGPLDVNRQRSRLATSPDAHVREEAFKHRYQGFLSQRRLIAFSLIHTVKAQNLLAQEHRYHDAPTRKYFGMELNPEQTKTLLNLMGQRGDVVKRFEKIRSSDFEEATKTSMHAWDLQALPPGLVIPAAPLSDVPRIFHEAFAALGAEYQSAFDDLLNPLSARADVVPGGMPGRYQGGFSIGFQGSMSILFFGRYDGTFKDLSVIAHEGGHAVHRALMSAHGLSPLYADGPAFLFESFAAFNELLLADYMAAHSTDPRLRRYYLEQWMGIKGLDAFYGAQDALLEQKIYDGVSSGSVQGADDLDKITDTVDSQFSIFPAITPELRNRWATASLMYEDPLYDVNYVYGGLLALKYYQLYSRDRNAFVARYVALLKNGFDGPPATLLKQFLDIDLLDSSLLADDLSLLDGKLKQLEAGR
jgi:oligoendopeptidase F